MKNPAENHRMLGALVIVMVVNCAQAVTYYWQGDRDADPTQLSNYKDGSGNSPAQFDGIDVTMKSNGQEVTFTDVTMWALAKMNSFTPRNQSKIFISINQDWTVGTRPNPDGNYTGVYGAICKSGSGTLELTNDDSTGTASNVYTYDEYWEVKGGRVVFPQENVRGKKYYHCGRLSVSNGCEVVLFGSRSAPDRVYVQISQGFCGAGNILYTNAVRDCWLCTKGTAPEPFFGRILAPKAELRPNMAILAGTNNVYNGNYVYGTLAGRILGSDGATLAAPNSLGGATATTTLNGENVVIRNMGMETDGPQSSYRRYSDYYATGTVAFDAGDYGNLTLNGGYLQPAFGLRMKELILTGNNRVRSTFANMVYTRTDAATSENGFYYLTKRGAGIWRIPSTYQNYLFKVAGIGVEEGVLEYETIAEQGAACSLGLAKAENLYGYAYQGTIAAAPAPVRYAIRLGTAKDLSKEGSLTYCGTADAACRTRPIAVTGRGCLANNSDKSLYLKDVQTVVPPEGGVVPASNVLALDGSGTASTLVDVTEGTGAGTLSIEKRGTGTWSLDGDVTASGNVTVREGTLNVRNYDYFTWFRFTITQTRGGSPDVDEKTGVRDQSELMDLALFDANGIRQNAGLQLFSMCNVGANEGLMPAGYATYGRQWTDKAANSLAYLFARPAGTSNYWLAQTTGHPVSAGDPDSHVPVVMHLADGAEKIRSIDFVHRHNPTSGSYVNTAPRQFTLEGSVDGKTWRSVTNVTDVVVTTFQSTYWYSKAAVGSPVIDNALVLPDTSAPASDRHAVFPNGITRLRVDPGATFRMAGSSVTVKGLEIDVTGAGTVENVSFTAAGTIDLVGVDPMAKSLYIPFDFSGLEGADNLSSWSVRINGSDALTRHFACVVTPTGIRLTKKGFVLIVR